MATPAGMHALRRRDVVHLADIKPRSNARVAWERVRHRQAHWVVECLAEMVSPLRHRCPRAHPTERLAFLATAIDGRVLLRLCRCVFLNCS